MGLFLQIVVFLIVAAAFGFAIGWLVRGSRFQAETESLEADWQTRLARVTDERERLQSELALAQQATADRADLAARVTELQDDLARAQQVSAKHQAEVGRFEARIAELEAGAAGAANVRPGAKPAVAKAPGTAPARLPQPEGKADDLQKISGIGPGIERTLHRLGIFHFRQIAAFTADNVAWVNQRLRFKGRIEREDWIGQAKRLAAGNPPLQ